MFQRIADWVSEFIGTPINIIAWILLVVVWFLLFGLGILDSNSSVLPGWFTSNAFNFPLNTITTLAELYIGFLIAAAANRTERRSRELHQVMLDLLKKVELEDEEILQHIESIDHKVV